MAHYCLTSTIMLSLTTNDESSGTFSLSGSIRRQVHVFSFFSFTFFEEENDYFSNSMGRIFVPLILHGKTLFEVLAMPLFSSREIL